MQCSFLSYRIVVYLKSPSLSLGFLFKLCEHACIGWLSLSKSFWGLLSTYWVKALQDVKAWNSTSKSSPLSVQAYFESKFDSISHRAGEAVTFCWRLERSPNFVASKGDSDVLQYNLKIEVRSRSLHRHLEQNMLHSELINTIIRQCITSAISTSKLKAIWLYSISWETRLNRVLPVCEFLG